MNLKGICSPCFVLQYGPPSSVPKTLPTTTADKFDIEKVRFEGVGSVCRQLASSALGEQKRKQEVEGPADVPFGS